MKKYYSDYVGHCARFYFNTDTTPSPVEKKVEYNNYVAVSNVLDRYEKDVALMIRYAYTSESIPKAIGEISARKKCKPEAVWYTIQTFEKDVATERGLL